MKTFRSLAVAAIFVVTAFITVNSSLGQQKSRNTVPGYGQASYTGLTDSEFMKNWLILGPVKIESNDTSISEAKQKEFFDQDLLTIINVQAKKPIPDLTVGNNSYTWKAVASDDGLIDFGGLLGHFDYSVAYALAEIKMDAPVRMLISIGSDDAVKVFLNGKPVHNNWIARETNPDEDIISLNLLKGSNQILVKVQNMEQDWSFKMRKPGKEIVNKLLFESAGRGDLDNVKLLVENGADVNASDNLGLTACQIASIRGREKVINYLKEKGAKTDFPMPPFEKLVSDIFKSTQNGSTPGVSVLASKNGEILYEKGFGYADVGNKVPVTPETKFRIGSITKQFIAVSILKLQEEGKISVKDTLSKFYPGFPRGNEVTVHHLLTHTSGIHSYTNRPDFLKYVTLNISPDALIDTIKTLTYDFNPGDQYIYNNSGFFLLGCIIEKISGKNLADYLTETLFKPLGMNNTGIYQTTKLIDNEAYGYSYENGSVVKALDWDMSWAGGAGALYSTARDLHIWNEAVFNGKVISDESMKAAFTPVLLNNKQKIDYGYGWALDEYRGFKFISHGGGLHGFTSYIERQPDNKINIVVLCNSIPSPEGINTSANAMAIAEYLLWPEMANQSTIDSDLKIEESILQKYVGRYDYGQGAVLIVSLEGEQLYAQLTGQPKFPIFPASTNQFNWKVVEASVKFISDEAGNVTHAVHNQNGQQFEAKKLVDETPVSADPALYDKYTGKYSIGNMTIDILKEGDKLYAQGTNLPKFQLLPASATEYFTREMNVRLKFKTNESGVVDAIGILIGGAEQIAKRISIP